jgi:2,3-bisphosphoglycerate-independent phosphoglycerate mutase
MNTARSLLIVLDGFGIGKDSPFNAIANARKPFFDELLKKYPHSNLITHGLDVGLPQGIMGNSEVGHMTMGAGRVIYQDLTRISQSITDKSFFKNSELNQAIDAGSKKTGRVHLMGLLSDAGVHSHIEHLEALLTLCLEKKIPKVYVHAFLDGRDSPPNSSPHFVSRLLSHPIFQEKSVTQAKIATIMGRFFAMDRDNRWDRVQKAYLTMTGQAASADLNPLEAIEASYSLGKTDEFIEPILFDPQGAIQTGDSLIFYNYRSDRAREITRAFTVSGFNEFDRGTNPQISAFCGMTQYDAKLPTPLAFGPQNLNHLMGQWLEMHKLHQLRLAETEKYAHVTFFFNGGTEKPFLNEERILIPSVKDVPTYDLKPEMSAFEIATAAKTQIELQKHDFILMNFANADMVGHTGNYEAAVRAIEALDQCLAKVVGAAEKNGYHTLITADHGNAESMCDEHGGIHTQHTLNPVPAIWVAPGSAIAPQAHRYPLLDGSLANVMPTLLDLMNLPVPPEVTTQSLLKKK